MTAGQGIPPCPEELLGEYNTQSQKGNRFISNFGENQSDSKSVAMRSLLDDGQPRCGRRSVRGRFPLVDELVDSAGRAIDD